MSFYRIFLLISSLLYIIQPVCLKAQSGKIKFESFTVDQGLSQSNINCILQDKKGFIWFGTNGGLNRFDGSEFKIFVHNAENSNSISNNIINHLFEDKDGLLWISTQNGLNVYNKTLEKFSVFKPEKNNPNSLSNNHITCTVQDNFGNYWIGTFGGGLNKFNIKDSSFTNYQHLTQNPESISSNYITCLTKDKYGFIWVGTAEEGLNMLDPETGKFLRYTENDENESARISSNKINIIYEDNDGDLWVGTSHGLNLIKPTPVVRNMEHKDNIVKYIEEVNNNTAYQDNNVMCIYQGVSGLVWFGTNSGGLGCLNKYTGYLRFYEFDPNDEHSLLSNNIKSVFDDRSGILWIGTNAGINLIDLQGDRFTLYKRKTGVGNTISSNNVTAIYKEMNGTTWIGTYDKGLNKYEPQADVYTTYLENDVIENGESLVERTKILRKFDSKIQDNTKSKIQFLSNNRILSLYRDLQKTLWIGTGKGLNKLNISSGKITSFLANKEDPKSLSGNVIHSILEDQQGNLWLGTEDGGLNKYDGKIFTHYVNDVNDIFSISSNDVRTLALSNDGTIWVGTFGGGLNKFNPKNEKFTRFTHSENNKKSLGSNTIYYLHLDDSSRLWIGTADGLDMLPSGTNKFHHYSITEGLPSNFIYSILNDQEGNIWLSSNKGISKLDVNKNQFKNYDTKDDLQGNEFNPGAAFVSKNNEMFFGGINGYNSFFPDQIVDNTYIPDVVITDFKILNERVEIGVPGSPLSKHISETDTLIISYKDKAISFDFVALNFTDSEKNEYEYILDGFEKDWNKVGNRHYANYTNLAPGTYVFRVRGSNNDGVWNEEGAAITIIVKPPFWKTYWFFIIVSLTIIFLVYLIIQVRTKSLQRSKIRLEEKVKHRTRQLEQEKTRVLTANEEITLQKNEIEKQRDLLVTKNEEVSRAKYELDQINEKLKTINSNLEEIVSERTSKLRKTNEDLKKANAELDLFIYRSSHDLQGPLARLLGLTQVAKLDKNSNKNEYIDIMEKGAIDMNRVLNKLINIHLINKEEVHVEKIDFMKMVYETANKVTGPIEKEMMNITIDKHSETTLHSDPTLIRIILENLLENSLAYRKTDKANVTISLVACEEQFKLNIIDDGIGISNDHKNKIFNMFYKGTERSKGNGLGLYLVKKAVNKLKGQIFMESAEGMNTSFTIQLPKKIPDTKNSLAEA